MKIIRSIKTMFNESQKAKRSRKSIGFVPTMGALHEGHLSLIRRSIKDNDITIVSIFVNPAQFGPKEDFKKYPREPAADTALCRKAGVDFVFFPDPAAMYPPGFDTEVNVKKLSLPLCGKFRKGHFQGVSTVVLKLFNIVLPDNAYFGQKDYQQACIVKRMCLDLNFPVKIEIMPIVREKSGLALSSRNRYLNPAQARQAESFYKALTFARRLLGEGIKDPDEILNQMKNLILRAGPCKIDYLNIVDPENLLPLKKITGKCVAALAVRIGHIRLIDNIILEPA